MTITFSDLLVWIIISLIVGFLGELIAHRRAPDGIIGAAVLGFIAIFIIVGLLHFSIAGEPTIDGVPLISSVIAAAILVAIWSGFAYRRVSPYYRRGHYVSRRRWW
jgi:uncharacterized membrane protein YeaQ/YmgE (transglycosylase-associated protein family)